uniref:aldo/keto reductase n=1 Tax=uncultured Draconibacterium sp. TaxID=1573823 RepID=UPI0032163949
MKKISRRKFIEHSVIGTAAVSASGFWASCSGTGNSNQVPRRVLGKTGLEVSILSFGGGSQFCKNREGEWEKIMEEAIQNGVNLFDTAPSYNIYKGDQALGSDERFGQILPPYRNKVVIATKLETRKPGDVKKEIEGSLARMNTDYIDILLMHAINDSDSVSDIENGVYKEMLKLKKEGVIRFIGFSSMDSAQRSKDLLDNLDIDVALLAMNATRYGDFAKLALPSAIKQNTGVMAMKVMRNIVGKGVSPGELLEYAWGQKGVATALIAHYGLEPLRENIKLAKEYQGKLLASVDRHELELRMAKYAGPHALCWAQPGYTDGEYIA